MVGLKNKPIARPEYSPFKSRVVLTRIAVMTFFKTELVSIFESVPLIYPLGERVNRNISFFEWHTHNHTLA